MVLCVGELIIKDAATGQSYKFQPTAQGYAEADRKVQEINQNGHSVISPDLKRLSDYFGR